MNAELFNRILKSVSDDTWIVSSSERITTLRSRYRRKRVDVTKHGNFVIIYNETTNPYTMYPKALNVEKLPENEIIETIRKEVSVC